MTKTREKNPFGTECSHCHPTNPGQNNGYKIQNSSLKDRTNSGVDIDKTELSYVPVFVHG